MTPQSFGLLLAALGDHAADGSHYERLRSKLIFFFTRKLLPVPEDLADEVMDRLAQRLADGIQMNSVEAFALGIARHVAQEQQRRTLQTRDVDPGFFDNIPTPSITWDGEDEIACMERCLKKLSRSESQLLRGYYLTNGKNPVAARKKLSDTLGISAIALRQRVFLLRQRLRECMASDATRVKR